MNESELILQLTSIKYALYGIFTILCLLLLVLSVATMGNVIARKNQYSQLIRDDFVSTVQKHENAGCYSEMIQVCEKRIEKFPHDVEAIYFLGLAHNKDGNPGKALTALAKVKEIDPAWERKHIDEYIDDIKATMNGPSSS